MERLSTWFAPAGLRFFLKDVKRLAPTGVALGQRRHVREAFRDPELHPRDQPFFIPLVLVRDLKIGVKTTPGVGTLPGGVCADLGPPPGALEDDGVIIMARLRNHTTLAHELGHYFGLCHTHQADPVPPRLTVREDGVPLECAACGLHGDGVCDTAPDPGVEACTLDEEHCTASCPGGAAPDPSNLMSYFVPCRRLFSDEQSAYLRRYARLRLKAR